MGLVPEVGRQHHRARRHHRRPQAEEAERRVAAAADADRPRAHLEGRQRGRRQDLPQRAERRQAVGRLGAVRPGRGSGRRSQLPVRPPTPTTGAASRSRRGRLQRSTDRKTPSCSRSSRRDRLRRGRHPLQIKKLDGAAPTSPRSSATRPGFDEIAFNTGSVDTDTWHRHADGRPQPRGSRPEVPLRAELRDRPAEARRQGLPGRRQARNNDHPAGLHAGLRGSRDDPDAFAYDLDKANQLLDEAGYTVGSDGLRTSRTATPIGKLRLYARSDSPTSKSPMEFFQEWLKDVDIDSEGHLGHRATS